MKKWLAVVGLTLIPALCLVTKRVHADGNFLPVLVVSSTTNQGYLYSNSPSSSQTGGVLVNNGGGAFNWSNLAVGTTTSATVTQFPAFSLLTSAQIQALTPATTGQMVMCTNCTGYGNGILSVCISSGVAANQWIEISTQTTVSGCK